VAAQLEAKRSISTLAQQLTRGQLSTPRLLLVAGALVLVAYVALGVAYLGHRSDREVLTAQVRDGQAALAAAETGQSIDEIEAHLTELTNLQTLLEASFPAELKTPAVIDSILRRAREHNVALVQIDIGAPESVQAPAAAAANATPAASDAAADAAPKAPAASYRRAMVTAKFRGSLPDLIAFMAALEARVGSASRLQAFSLEGTEQGYTLDLQVQTFARQAIEEESAPAAAATPAAESEAP
jgi:hypothetical protein